jgi:nucleotide-binding universal stress UspA family protein
LRQRAAVAVVTDVLHGDIGPTLCGEIDKPETDLVVMATHGRGAFERFWLGSTTDDVIRHSSKPVLLVRPEEGPVDLGAEPRFSPALVSLDGTAFAETVLDHAVKLVGLSPAAEIILMRAIQGVAPTSAAPDVEEARREADNIRRQVHDLQSHLRQEAQEYLEGVAGRLRPRGLNVRTHVVIGDQPAQAILEEARSSGAALIALETHGRAGLTRLLIGSVADKVIRAATVPVLVHRRSG